MCGASRFIIASTIFSLTTTLTSFLFYFFIPPSRCVDVAFIRSQFVYHFISVQFWRGRHSYSVLQVCRVIQKEDQDVLHFNGKMSAFGLAVGQLFLRENVLAVKCPYSKMYVPAIRVRDGMHFLEEQCILSPLAKGSGELCKLPQQSLRQSSDRSKGFHYFQHLWWDRFTLQLT